MFNLGKKMREGDIVRGDTIFVFGKNADLTQFYIWETKKKRTDKYKYEVTVSYVRPIDKHNYEITSRKIRVNVKSLRNKTIKRGLAVTTGEFSDLRK